MSYTETVVDGYLIQVWPNRNRTYGLVPGVAVTFVTDPGNFIRVQREDGLSSHCQRRCNVPDTDVERATAEMVALVQAGEWSR